MQYNNDFEIGATWPEKNGCGISFCSEGITPRTTWMHWTIAFQGHSQDATIAELYTTTNNDHSF